MPIITLLTDFGSDDEYVGIMKGVILSVYETANIVDITHGIPQHDIRQAALVLKSAYHYFPRGSIHVAVVDPGVGGKRNILCLKQNGHYFIAPNNGILTAVIQEAPTEGIYAVTNRTYFLEPISHTFHGRDIFAPVAAQLAKGVDISELGNPLTHQDIILFNLPQPSISHSGHLTGEIISVDHFGNMITNIDRPTFCRTFCKSVHDVGEPKVLITLAGIQIHGVSTSYEDIAKGTPLGIFGSRDLLEISVNQGNAKSYFNARIGQRVVIIPGNPSNDA